MATIRITLARAACAMLLVFPLAAAA
ncbi:hypothetical protein L613_012300000060, partial [Pseudoxanthomonas taiwanensis J19]